MFGRTFRRLYATEAPVKLTPPRPATTKWGRRALVATGLFGALYIADIWANDDWEIITDRFRRHLSEQERRDRPNVVILGSGIASPFRLHHSFSSPRLSLPRLSGPW